ncbi:unnamed protein product, partial [Brassica rapa subsp. narinosa]
QNRRDLYSDLQSVAFGFYLRHSRLRRRCMSGPSSDAAFFLLVGDRLLTPETTPSPSVLVCRHLVLLVLMVV